MSKSRGYSGSLFTADKLPETFPPLAHTLPLSNTRSGAIAKSKSLTRPKNETATEFAIEAARLAANTRCNNVVLLDVRGLSPVCDYFVIATGTSTRQMRSVADEISELGEKFDHKPLSVSGYEGDSWILADYVDVIVHFFSESARSFYDLDNLWGDAKPIDWNAGATKA